MQEFKVGVHYSETGHINVRAYSANEAEKKVEKWLEEDGLDNIKIRCTGREYGVTYVQSLNGPLVHKFQK